MAVLFRRDLSLPPSSLGQRVDNRRLGRVGGPEKGGGDDGDPEQEGISLAHVDVDHQNVVAAAAAAVVDGVVVGTPVEAEEKDWGAERDAAKVSIEKR